MITQQSAINGQTVQGWLLQDQQGRYGNASNGFAWMNPAVPQVRQLLINLTLEAVRRYDIDGVQLDDRLAWPREFGWDATTAAYYFAETGRNLPTNVSDANFRSWRQSKVRLFATELYNALKGEDPNLLVSVSPSVIGFSDTQYNAAWGEWVSSGLFDEYVPQVYRSTIASFQSELPANVAPFVSADREDDMVVGIRFNGSGGNTPLADVQQMITTVRNTAGGMLSGHSIWYSSAMVTNQAAMTSFYDDAVNGPAAHPNFGVDYRPPPLVAQLMGGSTWRVNVPSPANYRLAAKIGTFWKEIALDFYSPGSHEISVPGATAVELLLARRLKPAPIVSGDFSGDGSLGCVDIDRLVQAIAAGWQNLALDVTLDGLINLADLDRWLQLAGAANLPSGNAYRGGDANLDGVVDGTDFNIWNGNKFTAQAAWCRGDFSADGFIDGSDFNLWNSNKFTSANNFLSVPEPESWRVMVLMAIWLRATFGRHFARRSSPISRKQTARRINPTRQRVSPVPAPICFADGLPHFVPCRSARATCGTWGRTRGHTCWRFGLVFVAEFVPETLPTGHRVVLVSGTQLFPDAENQLVVYQVD
jgi:hypothetical protein